MKAFTLPAGLGLPAFVDEASVAGCGGNCGGGCGGGCSSSGGSAPPGSRCLMMSHAKRGVREYAAVEPTTPEPPDQWCPGADPDVDAQFMTRVAGTATIAAGATATINIEPTQGCFDGYYVQILAVDNANPNTDGRVEIGRFNVGDCPGDCRTLAIFSDFFEGLSNGCCMGIPFRVKFGRTNNGDQLSVTVTNPTGGFANARVQVVVAGICNRGSCAC